MKEKDIETLFSNVLKSIMPTEKDIHLINVRTEKLVIDLKNSLKNRNIKAEVFVGGSLAKNTIIKKNKYDIDIFIRLKNEVDTNALEKIIRKIDKNVKKVHGSRDYFILKIKNTVFEIVPVKAVKKPTEAKNSTDLSYFHITYIRNKIKKSPKLAEDIRLAKAFSYSAGCYGAESYVNGFSGYALELLIISNGSFLKFVREISKAKDRIIIDIEKKYKNTDELMTLMNEAKIQSPIILIDPTFKERNATASLSKEKFDKFKEHCSAFLKKPSHAFFEKSELDINELKKTAKKLKAELIKIILRTNRQEGDIAGTKLRKASEFLAREVSMYSNIVRKEFVYDLKKAAIYYMIAKEKDKILKIGPPIKMNEHVEKFKAVHKKTIIKNGRIYAVEKVQNIKSLLKKAIIEKKEQLKVMGVADVRIIRD